MRKMTFKIDVLDCLYTTAVKQNPDISPEKIKNALPNSEFKAIYTLYGKSGEGNTHRFPDRYTLTDYDGNRIDFNSLRGLEKSILNACFGFYHDPENYMNKMFGVVEATDEDLPDE